jgi:hypothetical protein
MKSAFGVRESLVIGWQAWLMQDEPIAPRNAWVAVCARAARTGPWVVCGGDRAAGSHRERSATAPTIRQPQQRPVRINRCQGPARALCYLCSRQRADQLVLLRRPRPARFRRPGPASPVRRAHLRLCLFGVMRPEVRSPDGFHDVSRPRLDSSSDRQADRPERTVHSRFAERTQTRPVFFSRAGATVFRLAVLPG